MNEALRLEIVQRHQQGASRRAIAHALGLSRGAVTRALARVQEQRDGAAASAPKPRRCGSLVDEYEPVLKELLARYPNLTVERALQELRGRGYGGGYTILRQRMRLLRPRAPTVPVTRFETGPGASTDGLRCVRHRFHSRRPTARLSVQLPLELFTPAVPAFR